MPNDQLLIGENIRKWRELRGYKQVTFAALVGISKATLSRIENNKQTVSIPRLQKIAICLKINATQLFKDPGELISGQ
ncbi:helix-turn-helix domain-containing protein [Ferruginibacter sp.]